MNKENSFIGQIDLLALLGAEIREIDSQDCIVIPMDANPTIEVKEKRNGELKAQLGLFFKNVNGKFGNSHFVKAIVSKGSRERMSMTFKESLQFSPILGNIKPLSQEDSDSASKETVKEVPERRERFPRNQYGIQRERRVY